MQQHYISREDGGMVKGAFRVTLFVYSFTDGGTTKIGKRVTIKLCEHKAVHLLYRVVSQARPSRGAHADFSAAR